jgi:hypothetical protein
MSQANAEGSEVCFGDGAERLEILEAGLEAIGQVLLKTKICERPLEVRGGSHARTGQTGEGARLARLADHVNASPIPVHLDHSARPSTRIGEAGCWCNGLDLESRILRIFICPESGHWLGLKSRYSAVDVGTPAVLRLHQFNGWVRCPCRHIIAHGPQSPFQLAEHRWGRICNVRYPLISRSDGGRFSGDNCGRAGRASSGLRACRSSARLCTSAKDSSI